MSNDSQNTQMESFTMLTILGAKGVLTNPSSGSCVRLTLLNTDDVFCTGLFEGDSPIWNESFVIAGCDPVGIAFELYRGLPSEGNLVAQVTGILDLQAEDGKELIWQLENDENAKLIDITFNVAVMFDDPPTPKFQETEIAPVAQMYSLTNFTLRVAPSERDELSSESRLSIVVLGADEPAYQTPAVQRTTQGMPWQFDDIVSVPANLPCIIKVLYQSGVEGDVDTGNRFIAQAVILHETMTSALKEKQRYTIVLDQVVKSVPRLEIAFRVQEPGSVMVDSTPQARKSSLSEEPHAILPSSLQAIVLFSAEKSNTESESLKTVSISPSRVAGSPGGSLRSSSKRDGKSTVIGPNGHPIQGAHILPQEELDTLYEDAIMTPDDDPDKPRLLADLGRSFLTTFERTNELPDIAKSVDCYEQAWKLLPSDNPLQAGYRGGWGIALVYRLRKCGEQGDVDTAISALQNTISYRPKTDPSLPLFLYFLGEAFDYRFLSGGGIEAVDEAIACKERAVALTSPINHPSLPDILHKLGMSLRLRYDYSHEPADLERAIDYLQKSADLCSDWRADLKAIFYKDLAETLRRSFEHHDNVENLHRSISALEKALSFAEHNPGEKLRCLIGLAALFKIRFEKYSNLADLDKAIDFQMGVTSATPDPNIKAKYASRLGDLYVKRHFASKESGESRSVHYLNKALEAKHSAVNLLPEMHAMKHICLGELGDIYAVRFDYTADGADLREAIRHQSTASSATSDDHPSKPLREFLLGSSYLKRFLRYGDPMDGEQSILVIDRAIRLAQDTHPMKGTMYFMLGTAYFSAQQKHQGTVDLEKARLSFEQARSIGFDFAGRGTILSQLPDFLNGQSDSTELGRLHFALEGLMADMEALGTNEPHTQPPSQHSLAGLGLVLPKHSRLEDRSVVERAIEAAEAKERQASERSSYNGKANSLSNLTGLRLARSVMTGDVNDVDQAVSTGRDALALVSDDDPRRAQRLFDLGTTLLVRSIVTPNIMDHMEAMMLLSQSAHSDIGQPSIRFESARRVAPLYATLARLGPKLALRAYGRAIELLPEVAWHGLNIEERYQLIVDAGMVTGEAMTFAIRWNQHESAVEWMEQGRSIVWGQLLQLRSPIDELEEREPVLAGELKEISQKLGAADDTSRDYRRLALIWNGLLEKARLLPGLEFFMRLKKFVQLSDAARSGPVVVLTADVGVGNALIILAGLDSILHVPLPGFSREKAEELQGNLDGVLTSITRSRSDRGFTFPRKEAADPDQTLKLCLFQLWEIVVKPVLEALALPCVSDVDDLPHIWWCPTGPLVFLPIHAAGNYDSEEPGTKLSDYAVSSYTPTITALLERAPSKSVTKFKLLAVGQAETPGYAGLPHTEKELVVVRSRAGQLPVQTLDGEDATVERVLEGMNECSWVHLACHGTQNPTEPTKSALILADGDLDLSTIIKHNLPRAEFAFLSACQTATGDVKLQEEAVHLAAGMLFAGYRSVIATSWSILDMDGPFVADDVYRELFKGGRPDRSRAAWALHKAIQKLRLSGASFARWIPFIHLGE